MISILVAAYEMGGVTGWVVLTFLGIVPALVLGLCAIKATGPLLRTVLTVRTAPTQEADMN